MEENLFHKSLSMVAEVAAFVKAENMNSPTPCTEWDTRMLLNHMINEIAWVKPLLEGKTIAEVGSSLDGDLVGEDAVAAWQKYSGEATKAAESTPPETIAHLSYADKSAGAYLNEVGADIIVHGWDLAQAVGAPYTIDDMTAEAVLDATKDVMPMAKQYGLVKEGQPAPEGASGMEKLLAAFGRTLNWKA